MSLWARTHSLREVQGLYGDQFPIEVRHYLSQWIEDNLWNSTDGMMDISGNESDSQSAIVFASFLQELSMKIQEMNDQQLFPMKLKLTSAAETFRQEYSHQPKVFLNRIRQCISNESKLLERAENPVLAAASDFCSPMNADDQEIDKQLELLRAKTQEAEAALSWLHQTQELFVIQYQESMKLQDQLSQLAQSENGISYVDVERKLKKQKQTVDQMLSQKATDLFQMRLNLSEKHKQAFTLLSNLQAKVLDEELIRWKKEQQLAGNGAQFNSNLPLIKKWCGNLALITWQNYQQIKRVETMRAQLPIDPPGVVDILPQLKSQITNLLSSLVTSTFIVEKQPTQVMKTKIKVSATVSLLVGDKLNVHMNPPQVEVSIISEAQANALLKTDKFSKKETSGTILNNKGTMEYHQDTQQLTTTFRNMQLYNIKRPDKKGNEIVTDEKFSLLFQSQFKVGDELVFHVWTLSLPVVVIVHGNQEPHAWATVSWDNAFSEPGRIPFAVPEKVHWPQVAHLLSCKFKDATGRGLSEEHLNYLAAKLFRNAPNKDCRSLVVSWSQFCKDPLPGRNFSFWEWFYQALKLTRDYLKDLWKDGHVHGFIEKQRVEELLFSCCNGTFLLRWSESELGGVTIAWVADGQMGGGREVFMTAPLTSKHMSVHSLGNTIKDVSHFVYLYPKIPKDEVFLKYYTSPETRRYEKYVPVKMICKLDSGPEDALAAKAQIYAATPPHTSPPYHQPYSPASDAGSYNEVYMGPNSTNCGLDFGDLGGQLPGDADTDMPVDLTHINMNDLLPTNLNIN